MMRVEGIVNVLKPPGMTSSDVVSDVRRLFNTKRVGHTGTLDPGASGVLPITLGRATRLFDILIEKEKEYIAEIAFGTCTDTQDSYGKITERDETYVSAEVLQAVLPDFVGQSKQTAPKYSALKSGGKSLYELARSGQEVPEKEREVNIYVLEYVAQTAYSRFLLRIRCSRGTYIRTLCEDIGKRIGACAHMSFLLRSASGTFTVEDAYSIAELSALKEEDRLSEAVLSIERVLEFLPSVHIQNQCDEDRLKNGCTLGADSLSGTPDFGWCRVYASELLGVGTYTHSGLKLKLHLWPADTE